MITEAEYKKLLEKAQEVLFSYPHLEAHDIVNDVLLECLESGKDDYFHEIVKKVRYSAKNTGANKTNSGSLKNGVIKNTKVYISEHTRVCKKCNEPLPISAFSIVRRKKKGNNNDAFNVITEVLYNCKECQKKIVKEYLEKKKSMGISTYTEAHKKAQKKYVEKIMRGKDASKYKRKQKVRVDKWHMENKEYFKVYQKQWSENKKQNGNLGDIIQSITVTPLK